LAHERKENIAEAWKSSLKAIHIKTHLCSAHHRSLTESYRARGEIFEKQGRYNEALTHFNIPLENSKKIFAS
jgi:tetratricopeptide (TPR) repeat protein